MQLSAIVPTELAPRVGSAPTEIGQVPRHTAVDIHGWVPDTVGRRTQSRHRRIHVRIRGFHSHSLSDVRARRLRQRQCVCQVFRLPTLLIRGGPLDAQVSRFLSEQRPATCDDWPLAAVRVPELHGIVHLIRVGHLLHCAGGNNSHHWATLMARGQ